MCQAVEANPALFQKQGTLASGLAKGRRVWSLRYVERGPDGRLAAPRVEGCTQG